METGTPGRGRDQDGAPEGGRDGRVRRIQAGPRLVRPEKVERKRESSKKRKRKNEKRVKESLRAEDDLVLHLIETKAQSGNPRIRMKKVIMISKAWTGE